MDQCWQLESCHFLEICEVNKSVKCIGYWHRSNSYIISQSCVSGPPSPPIISDCPWPPAPPTTTTTAANTTTTTTTPATTAPGTCDVFHREESCDLDELNIVDYKHDIRVGDCQDSCVDNNLCNFFTWSVNSLFSLLGTFPGLRYLE